MAEKKSFFTRYLWGPLRVAGVAYVAICAFVFLFQSRMLYIPSPTITATPKDIGLEYEEVSIDTEDGLSISAWFVPADEDRGVVLFCHGNAGNISNRLDTVRIFTELGFSVLVFDYRGYGTSEGTPSEAGTYADARAAWDYLVDTRGTAPENIIIAGRSLGGAVAAHLATQTRPRAVILESTFTSVPQMGAEQYPYLPVKLLCKFSYNTKEIIGKLSCPKLIVHSPDDDLIPFRHGRALFEAAGTPKVFLEITGNHNSGYLDSGNMYTRGLEAFLSSYAGTGSAPQN